MSSYDAVRGAIRSGHVLAFRRRDLLGELIEHVTGASYCHIGLAWVLRGRVFLLEAMEGQGVRLRALSEALPCDWLAIDIGWSDEVEAFALEKLGKPYSYLDAIKVGFDLEPSALGEICSLYVGSVMSFGRRFDPPRKGLTPGALVDFCLDHNASLQHIGV